MKKPKIYPLEIELFEYWAYSKGHHCPDGFAKFMRDNLGIDIAPEDIHHSWGRVSWMEGEYREQCLDYAPGPGRGVFPITEVTLL